MGAHRTLKRDQGLPAHSANRCEDSEARVVRVGMKGDRDG